MKKIFVVAAHPDDEILGCGGTLLKHIDNGDKVYILFVSEGVSGRYDKKDSKNVLSKLKKDKKWLKKQQYMENLRL